MPQILLSHPDMDQTITRVVAYDLIRHVMKMTGIDEKKTSIYYPDTEEQTYQPGSSIGADSIENELKPDTFNQLSITVNEEQDITFMNATNVFTPEHLFTFQDKALNITIRPSYAVMNLDIAVQFRTRDKNGAYRWRDQIRQKISAGQMTYLHDITYSYFLDDKLWITLQALYNTREKQAGYGDTFDAYLAEHLSGDVTTMVGLNGQNGVRAVRETQGELLGWFDFEGQPEHGGRDGVGDIWTLSFSYHLQYSKPTTSLMVYPIVVHNQLIDSRLRPTYPYIKTQEQTQQKAPLSKAAGKKFETDTPMIEMIRGQGLRIPNFDEFASAITVPHLLPMVTAAVLIDPANPQFLMSFMGTLDTYVIDPDILAWMQEEAPYMSQYGQSIFHVTLYEFGTPNLNGKVKVDGNLNVTLVNPPDLRVPYHVMLSINRDIGGLPAAAKERIRFHCKALIRVLKVISDRFAGLNDSYCLPGDFLTPTDISDLSQMSNQIVYGQGYNSEEYGFYMIQTLGIITTPRALVNDISADIAAQATS